MKLYGYNNFQQFVVIDVPVEDVKTNIMETKEVFPTEVILGGVSSQRYMGRWSKCFVEAKKAFITSLEHKKTELDEDLKKAKEIIEAEVKLVYDFR